MKLAIAIMVAASSLLALPGVAAAEEKAADTAKKPDPMAVAAGVKVTATVVSVDMATRMVVLKGPKGNLVEIYADERVKNLPQLKAGDLLPLLMPRRWHWRLSRPVPHWPNAAKRMTWKRQNWAKSPACWQRKPKQWLPRLLASTRKSSLPR